MKCTAPSSACALTRNQMLTLLAYDSCACLQWDGVENKSQVLAYAGGALVLLWLSSTIVSAVNTLPLVRTCMSQWARHLPP